MDNANGRTVKVGIVGCGVVATAYYLPYMRKMPGVEITAVCDIHERRLRETARLFGAKQTYTNYGDMLKRADIEVVFILTAPGTHVKFTLMAVEAGKHVLLQKPMATTMEDANRITEAVRKAKVKALIEPSSSTLLDPTFRAISEILARGVLGDPYWFSFIPIGRDHYHPSLTGNPYGASAFYTKDSGGYLFDFPYAPTQIVSILGSCKSVSGLAKISVPDREIVGEEKYDEYLEAATDPDDANYWDVVVDMPRTKKVKMESWDNINCQYEMASGWIGVFHAGRLFHPMPKGSNGGGLEVFGTEGNLIFGRTPHAASIISSRKDLLPSVDADGWYHFPRTGDQSKAKWPKPTPGAFNYYHESTRHLIECIRDDRDPLVNVEWGRHITEMMFAAAESYRTGRRYEMTTTTTGLVGK